MIETGGPAPELEVAQWFNSEPLTLSQLRGTVVVLHAFQMLCPGCVLHGTPFAQRLHETFAGPDVTVIGLHTVFEHHAAMTPVALQAYLHEFRITMPVGVDRPSAEMGMPQTMAAFRMQGTPTLIVIDKAGVVRAQAFGSTNELAVAKLIVELTHAS